jgi:hypothetical protein
MNLLSSTGAATIGDGATSQAFLVQRGIWNLYVTGTASTATLTLQWSRKKDTGFVAYVYDDAGTPATYTITVAEVASASVGWRDVFVDGGMYFRFVDDGAGTGTSWSIDVSGDNVVPVSIT